MNADAVALLVRVGVFLGALALLPRQLVPLSAHAALGLAILLVALPTLQMEPGRAEAMLLELHRQQPALDLRILLLETAVGMFIAVSVSLAGYGARIAARWISAAAHSPQEDAVARGGDAALAADLRQLEYPFLLVLLIVLFSSPSLMTALFGVCAEALAPSTMREIFAGGGAPLRGAVSYIGSSAFVIGLMLALPIFAVSLAVDVCAAVLGRYAARFPTTSLVGAIKLPLLLLMLSLCVYPIAQSLGGRLERSISKDTLDAALSAGAEEADVSGK